MGIWHRWRKKQIPLRGCLKGSSTSDQAKTIATYCEVSSDRLVHWHQGRCDRNRITLCRTGPVLCRPGSRHFYRKAIGRRATKKRQTPAPIPPRLLAHMRRWHRRKLIATCFVEFNGKPVSSVELRRLPKRGPPRRPLREGHTPHPSPYRRDPATILNGFDPHYRCLFTGFRWSIGGEEFLRPAPL